MPESDSAALQAAPAASPLLATPPAGARIVIVGAAGGLGRALAAVCTTLDLNVALLDLPGALERLDPTPGSVPIAVDATDPASVADAFEAATRALGGLDHAFHLAGLSTIPPRPLRDLDVAEWDRVIAGNLRSAFLCAAAAIARFDGAAPSLVLVSSTMTVAPNPGYGAYIAAKSGIGGLVKALAAEHAPRVRVNAVAPSAMLTPFMGGGPLAGRDRPEDWAWFNPAAAAAAIPLRRLCTPDDVVGPMLFLSSPMAAFITGQLLHVSGGRVMP